jgi:AbrB family looped-hinge helix DNA binding protein
MISTTVTKKGQVTIPKEIREALGVKEQDKMIFVLRGKEVIMKPLRGSVLDLRGSVDPKARPERFEHVRQKVKRERGKSLAGELKDE